jgi:hypothetical protein
MRFRWWGSKHLWNVGLFLQDMRGQYTRRLSSPLRINNNTGATGNTLSCWCPALTLPSIPMIRYRQILNWHGSSHSMSLKSVHWFVRRNMQLSVTSQLNQLFTKPHEFTKLTFEKKKSVGKRTVSFILDTFPPRIICKYIIFWYSYNSSTFLRLEL